ncbi:MAG: methyltransferase domain-containing protein [Polyangiales bacterium]
MTAKASQVPPAAAPTVDPGRTDEERAYYATTRRVYGSWFASVYELVTAPFGHVREFAARDARIATGARVLDVATGTGAQARAFADAGASVIGLDLSERMIAVARHEKGSRDVRFLVGDATALPFDAATFDVTCISFALHEMPPTVRSGVLCELARVTRPGGTVVVVDYALPRNPAWRRIVVGAVRLFEHESYPAFLRADLVAALREVGVEVTGERRVLLDVARVVIGRRATSA